MDYLLLRFVHFIGLTLMGAIWRIWPDGLVRGLRQPSQPTPVVATNYRVPLWGAYFSVRSAIHIGWRDLNVGNWFARISPQEFTLRATGLVKVVSGVLSLVSVYLVAQWALNHFSQPFEWRAAGSPARSAGPGRR